MHDSIKKELIKFAASYVSATSTVADLGSYNINGSVKDIIHNTVGFDICPGNGVDVVIIPGIIPPEHQNRYSIVTSTGSFQTCPSPQEYKIEIINLLVNGGVLFLSMCDENCKCQHSTSPNQYHYKDGLRMPKSELVGFFSDAFSVLECYKTNREADHDLIYIGRRK